MTCHDARELFSARVDEALPPDEAAHLDAHLAGCPECRAEWARFERTVSLVQGLEPARAPVGFADRVLEAARPVPWHRRLLRRLFLPVAVKLPVEATAVVLVAGLAVMVFQHSPEMQKAARQEYAPVAPQAPAPRVPAAQAPEPPRLADERAAASGDLARPEPLGKVPPLAPEARVAEPPARATEDTARPATPAPVPDRQREELPAARAPAAQRAAALASPPMLSARLVAKDRTDAGTTLRAAIGRVGGTELARRIEDRVVIVDAVIPREGYPFFMRELGQLGTVTVDAAPPESSTPVTVRIRVTD
jgi:putative zinc finger protein